MAPGGNLRIVHANAAHAQAAGTAAAALAGRPLEESLPALAAQCRRCLAQDAALSFEEEREAAGHSLHLRTPVSPLRSGGRTTHLLAVSADLTPQRRQELELQAARDRAAVADRAKAEFMANMSHELRTPLNAVIGYAELMQAELFGPLGDPRYAGHAGAIAAGGRHLLAVVEDILRLAGLEGERVRLQESEIGPAALLQEAADLAGPGGDGALPQVAAGAIRADVAVAGDRRLLAQALLNLIGNARRFVSKAGRPERAVRLGAELLADGQLCFYVADGGRGIAAADLPRALAPFGRIGAAELADSAGAGLGLPITQAIAERHGGSLLLNSLPEVGTTAFLVLPAARVCFAAGPHPPPSIAGLADFFRVEGVPVAERAAGMSEAMLDRLPIGAILLDAAGRVQRYNAVEAGFAELRPERVIGRSFFREVAPCTFDESFHGRFRAVSASGSAQELFSFVFTLRRPWRVLVEMRPGPQPGWVWLFVRWV